MNEEKDNLPADGVSPEPVEKKRTIAQRLFDATFAEAELESALILDFDHLGWDYYDGSLEIHGVAPDCRLDDAALVMLKEAGFSKIYVNHTDKWETHYGLRGYGPHLPWRVSYPHKRKDGGAISVEEVPSSWPAEANVQVDSQGTLASVPPQAEKDVCGAPQGEEE